MGDSLSEMGDALPYTLLGTGLLVRNVSAGYMHVCAILSNGYAKCWGSNGYGQLGYGDISSRGDGPNEMNDFLLHINLGSVRTVRQISCGYHHTCALLDNWLVKCWGANGHGQLGYSDTVQRGDSANEMGDLLRSVDIGIG